jgi:uncharacterized lipoprotein NlpE involved in copper resistance
VSAGGTGPDGAVNGPITIQDVDSLVLGTVKTTDDLAVTSTGGSITQSGPLNVGGDTTASADPTTGTVALNNPANAFTGSVGVSGSGATVVDSTPLTLGNTDLGSGGLAATSKGDITQAPGSTITSDGTTALTVNGSGGINLSGANDFGGTVNATSVALDSNGQPQVVNGQPVTQPISGSVAIADTGALTLGPINTTGNLVATAGGTGDLTLGTNSVGGNVTAAAGGALDLGTTTAGGNVAATAGGAVDLGQLTTTGNLAATSTGGSITQSGPLNVGGDTTASADPTTGTVALNNPANAFAGSVGVSGSGATVVDSTPLTLGNTDLGSGGLVVTSKGDITQAPGSTIASDGTTALTVNGSGGINLSGANDFGGTVNATSVALDSNGQPLLDSNNQPVTQPINGSVAIADTGALTLGPINTTGNLTTTAGGELALGATTVGGSLAANSAQGGITQSGGPMIVTGNATIGAGTGTVTLADPANEFGGSVGLSGAGATVVDSTPLTLGNTNLGNGGLNVASNGSITQAPGSTVSSLGDTALNLTAPGAIDLSGSNNDFGGPVSAARVSLDSSGQPVAGQTPQPVSGSVALADRNGLTLGDMNTAGNLTTAAGGAIDLGTSTVGGSLSANAASGGITQSGPLQVAQASTLTAPSGAVILDDPANTFTQPISLAAASADVAAAANLAFSTVTVSNGLTVASETGSVNLGNATITGGLIADVPNGSLGSTGTVKVKGPAVIEAASMDLPRRALTNGGTVNGDRVSAPSNNVDAGTIRSVTVTPVVFAPPAVTSTVVAQPTVAPAPTPAPAVTTVATAPTAAVGGSVSPTPTPVAPVAPTAAPSTTTAPPVAAVNAASTASNLAPTNSVQVSVASATTGVANAGVATTTQVSLPVTVLSGSGATSAVAGQGSTSGGAVATMAPSSAVATNSGGAATVTEAPLATFTFRTASGETATYNVSVVDGKLVVSAPNGDAKRVAQLQQEGVIQEAMNAVTRAGGDASLVTGVVMDLRD